MLGQQLILRGMRSATTTVTPTAQDQQLVEKIAPLSALLQLRCGPFLVPAAAVASSADLENETSEAADVARAFIAEDPWAGMGSVRAGGWMLLARDDDTMVIGQREGPIGMGAVVTLARDGSRFRARTMNGWSLALPNSLERAEVVDIVDTFGTTVTFQWNCGLDGSDDLADRTFSRFEAVESADEVHILFVSVPNPVRRTPGGGLTFSYGTGMSTTQTVDLTQPLGTRRLLNDCQIPPQVVGD